jgi:hypothetical protein
MVRGRRSTFNSLGTCRFRVTCQLQVIVSNVSVLVVGQLGTRISARRSHDKIASCFQGSSHAQADRKPKPEACNSNDQGPRRVSPARLSPRKRYVATNVHGLEARSVNIAMNALHARQRRCTADCGRRQGRLHRPPMPFAPIATLRNTSRPIVHVAVLPRSQANVGPGCHAPFICQSCQSPSPTASDQDTRVSS